MVRRHLLPQHPQQGFPSSFPSKVSSKWGHPWHWPMVENNGHEFMELFMWEMWWIHEQGENTWLITAESMMWENPSKGNGSNNILQHRTVILTKPKGVHYKQYLGCHWLTSMTYLLTILLLLTVLPSIFIFSNSFWSNDFPAMKNTNMAILCHWKDGWIAWRLLTEAWHRSENNFQIFKGKKLKCPKDLGACHSLLGFLSCQTFPYKVFTAKHLNSLHSNLVLFFPSACPSTVHLYYNLVGQTDILHLHYLASEAHAMVGVLK